jgi:A/G-specific adenine glycosylase
MMVPMADAADLLLHHGPSSRRPRRRFQRALLAWYAASGRHLRIRTSRAPWPVLVSEVMAQQTQVARVDEAWEAFMARFPTPLALAVASPADVLRAWQGLGYYRRAILLHRTARLIVEQHAGVVPGTLAELEALPGVGPYTSRAVAALAYGQPVAAVDTNVRRVLGRLLGRELPPRELQSAADALVAREDPAAWTHATMELGATTCRSRTPDCPACPVRRWCASADAPGGGWNVGQARGGTTAGSPVRPPFEHTTRWLRGRIVARLRDLDEGAWGSPPQRLGRHGPEQVASAIAALRGEGLLEQRADGKVRLPSGVP